MGCQRRQQMSVLLTATLCLAPLAAAKAYAGTRHFALNVQQAKVCHRLLLSYIFAFCIARVYLATATC